MKNPVKRKTQPLSRNVPSIERANTSKPPKYFLGMTQKLTSSQSKKLKIGKCHSKSVSVLRDLLFFVLLGNSDIYTGFSK